MARVTLYTKDDCPHCDRQRDLLAATGERIDEVNLSRSPQAMTELLKLTDGRRIVPVIVRGARIDVAPDGGSAL